MKRLVQSTLVVGLALSFGAPVMATELDDNDAVVASFYRDMDREPTRTGAGVHVRGEQDRLPEIVRAALEGGDPVFASFDRSLNHQPNSGEKKMLISDVEQDHLPGMVRAALEVGAPSNGGTVIAHRN